MKGVLKNYNFTWLFVGQTISQFGAAISSFTIPWLLLEITGSAMQMGFAFAIGFIPYLLLSLPAGVWADKFDRKKLMMFADVGRLVLIATLPAAHLLFELTVIQLFIVQAGISACSAIFDAAYGACLPNIVEKKELREANSMLQVGMSLSQILGPAVAGGLVGILGIPTTIVISGLAYFISSLTLLKIKKPLKAETTLEYQKGRMIIPIKEGLQYIWGNKVIRLTGVYALVLNFVIFSSSVALLFKIQQELGLDASKAGIMTASFSLGSVLGSIINGRINKIINGKRLLLILLLLQIFPSFIMAWTNESIIMVIINGIAGMILTIWNIQIITLRQSLIPDELMGRATTSIRLIAWCSIPLGNLFGGVLVESQGTTLVFILDGAIRIGLLLLSLYVFSPKQSKVYDFSLLEPSRTNVN